MFIPFWLLSLSQPGSQGSLGIDPFLSALAEVPDESPQIRGSAGGGEADNLLRGRHFYPSGVVPSPQEVISLTNVCDFVASANVASFSGSPFSPLGRDSVPVNRGLDQLHDRGDPGISQLLISGNFRGVLLLLRLTLLLFFFPSLILDFLLFLFIFLLLLPFCFPLPLLLPVFLLWLHRFLVLLFLFSLFPL